MTLDQLEICKHKDREITLLHNLPEKIEYAKTHTKYFPQLLSQIDSSKINSREALANLPVTRKSDLSKCQKTPPFGGMNAAHINGLKQIFQSPRFNS